MKAIQEHNASQSLGFVDNLNNNIKHCDIILLSSVCLLMWTLRI